MSNTKKKSQDKVEKEEMKQDDTKIEIERDDVQQQEANAEDVQQVIELNEKLESFSKENEQLRDQLLRKAAEFENYKRRTEIESANFIKYAGEAVITKMLPVYDDLRRSLEHADSKNVDSLKKGIELVNEKFTRILKEIGVEKIEAKGKEFDFNFHEALMQKEVEGVPSHIVLEEIEPGYMYKDKVIRHSKVIVSQASSKSDEQQQSENDKG